MDVVVSVVISLLFIAFWSSCVGLQLIARAWNAWLFWAIVIAEPVWFSELILDFEDVVSQVGLMF